MTNYIVNMSLKISVAKKMLINPINLSPIVIRKALFTVKCKRVPKWGKGEKYGKGRVKKFEREKREIGRREGEEKYANEEMRNVQIWGF